MELVVIGVIVVAVIGGVVFLVRRKKVFALKGQDYVLKGDQQAQQEYDAANAPPVVLNRDEKEELSWQFLYELTDHVLEKFSKEDQDKLKEIGQKMHDSGIQYEHVVNLGIRPEYMKQLEADAKRQKEGGGGRKF